MRGCGAGAAGGYGGAAGEGEECKHVREEAVDVEARHFVDLLKELSIRIGIPTYSCRWLCTTLLNE